MCVVKDTHALLTTFGERKHNVYIIASIISQRTHIKEEQIKFKFQE